MSLQHLIEDVRKPWLNARVENLTVDGTINNHGHLKLYFTGISTNTTPLDITITGITKQCSIGDVYFIGIEDVTGNLSINGWNMILLCNNNVVSLNGNALQNDNIMADAIVGAVRTFEPGLEDNEFILRMSSAGANPVSWTVYVDLYPSAN